MFKLALAASAGTMLLAISLAPAVAGQRGQASLNIPMCKQAVAAKHLSDKAARQAEFRKCMADPQNYK